MNPDRLQLLAWKLAKHLPAASVKAVARFAADVTWALRGRSVRLMEKNHQRVLGRIPTRWEMRAAVRSHFRNYAEQFSLGSLSNDEVATSVIFDGLDEFKKLCESGPLVAALAHAGNWDITGGWACANGLPVVTVAERLKNEELFNEFVNLREQIGLEVIGARPGEKVFSTLVDRVRGRSVLVPLLADRDVTGAGIEVDFGGHRALVAAGPAALAHRLNRPLVGLFLHYEKRGRRWLVRIRSTGIIDPPDVGAEENMVEAHTQAWVDAMLPLLRRNVRDWHMMQPLFLDDLDPERLVRARLRHTQEVGE